MQIHRPIRLRGGSGIRIENEVNRGRELACDDLEDSIKRHTTRTQASNSGTRVSSK